jgi:NAD(P)H-dependent FMN reductase
VPTLQILIASTRPGRVGLPVAEWFRAHAEAHGGFDLEVVDLAALDLPLLDEPKHPMLHEYTHEHTKRWSAIVERGDAFAFVMPEYNHGFNAPLKNALDYLNREWAHKPVGCVSYGGVAGGTRAVQMLKPVLVGLKMWPLFEAVPIPFVKKSIGEDGSFRPADAVNESAVTLLDALVRYEAVLRQLREPQVAAAS